MLDTILTDKTLLSSKDKNEKEKEKEKKNGNDETLMTSKNDDDNENENKNEDDDDETMSQNQKNEIIKENDFFDEIIDKSKSFEEEIKLLKKEKI